jgi:D-xylose transport system permease protein
MPVAADIVTNSVVARPAVDVRSLAMPLILATVWAFFAALSPQFVSPRNLSMLMIELSVTATLAVGMLLIILPGLIDLSAGSGVGLLGGIAAVLAVKAHVPAPLALASAFAAGILLWGAMGLAIVRLRVQAFIITLGGLLIFKGLFWFVIESSTVPVLGGERASVYSLLTTSFVPPKYGLLVWLVAVGALTWRTVGDRRMRTQAHMYVESGEDAYLRLLVMAQALLLVVLVCNLYRGIPLPLLILVGLALAVDWLTRQTPFGRYLYAIGGQRAGILRLRRAGGPHHCQRVHDHGRRGRFDGIYANLVRRRFDDFGGRTDGARRHCCLRDRRR